MKKVPAFKPKKRSSTIRTAGSNVRFKIVVDEKAIRKRVRELAKQINRDYTGKTVHVIGILEDAFIFMADLVRALTGPVVCYFVRSQVRDSDSGFVAMREILYIPPVDTAGKDLLIVDGLLQSGVTLDHLCQTLLAQQPASLRTAALIDKVEERKIDVPVDYAAFQISGRFLVGYGLGYQEQFRNLPFLARLTE
ncbi:MAG TPA: phosphoribosyltransferase family protein [Terriglobia bacterium]|nr:phosphoribosyltransferase family protein [Terriglobia bacterium]